jgi:hypothetical protein
VLSLKDLPVTEESICETISMEMIENNVVPNMIVFEWISSFGEVNIECN